MWKSLHLWLALISGLVMTLAVGTGVVLSIEPIYQAYQSPHVKEVENQSISEVINAVSEKYDLILSIRRDSYGAIFLETLDDSDGKFYIHPLTGEKLGQLQKNLPIFDFCRSLHRSLFLKSTGRFIMGMAAICLLSIAISGMFVVARKQGGWKSYWKKVVPNAFNEDYHTRIGRVLFFTALIISISAIYLFLVRFELLPNQHIQHTPTASNHIDRIAFTDFRVFEAHSLEELREIIFPFSDDPEEYFHVKLTDRELLLNQFNGAVMSEVTHNSSRKLADLSFMLHTGEGAIAWSIVLGLSSIGLMFMTYSGFAVFIKRKRNTRPDNPFPLQQCTDIILVGSEHGSSTRFANHLHQQLLTHKRKSYLCPMNAFQEFEKMERLFVFTSTYGAGEPPTNANKFIHLLETHFPTIRSIQYAVVGFGSTAYPDYCAFAKQVNHKLSEAEHADQMVPLRLINQQSLADYNDWINQLTRIMKLDLSPSKELAKEKRKSLTLKVLGKSDSPNMRNDHTFLLNFEIKGRKPSFESGDLLVITPTNRSEERLYSLARLDQKFLTVSVRRHNYGIGSNYLYSLKPGNSLTASIRRNAKFHFPKEAKSVVMIANGTGIAPFLGMIQNNVQKTEIVLFWGGQSPSSFDLYRTALEQYQTEGKVKNVFLAFSREGNKEYIQDQIADNQKMISELMTRKSTFMLCGSIAMRTNVYQTLDKILQTQLHDSLKKYQSQGLILEDCY
jgi:sulfite reductase (NADPH) flavoprotein alpha-component